MKCKASKSMKKVALIITLAVMCMVMPKIDARAESENGSWGDNFAWTLTEDGTLTISGSGAMPDLRYYSSSPLYKKTGKITAIVVSEGITEIGDWSFYGCTNATSVTLPASLARLGRSAFENCKSLTEISLPNSLITIDMYAFADCRMLKSIVIPDSVTTMDGGIFFRDTALENVTLPKNLTVISTGMFECCSNLKKVNIPNGVTLIKSEAFSECSNLEELVIPKCVTEIKDEAFMYAGMKRLVYMADVDTVPHSAFFGCTSIETVEIYNAANMIDCAAFRGCTSLKKVVIPDTVTFVESNAFGSCDSIIEVVIHGDNANPNRVRVGLNNTKFEEALRRATAEPHKPNEANCVKCKGLTEIPNDGIPSSNTTDPFRDDFMPAMIEQQIVYPDSTVNPSTLDCKFYHSNGKSYWYEHGVRQGTYDDPKGVMGDGTIRGREICDMDTAAWYWCDSLYNGAKACNKEVWMPYIYQGENNWSNEEIEINAAASSDEHADMSAQVARDIKAHTGKWVRYNANGKMLKGWYKVTASEAKYYPSQLGNIYYYDQKTGLMAKGYTEIDGVMYHFDETSGVLQR